MAGNSSSAGVEPIPIIWSKLLEVCGFHNIRPFGNLKFAGALEMGSIGLDEIWSRNVFDSNSDHLY